MGGGGNLADAAVGLAVPARQERCQVRLHRARTHARAAAAMGDAEGLVQVEVGDIRTPLAGPGQADQGIHVGAVGVDLAAVGVDDLADLHHVLLEHAVGGRIGDQDRGQVGRMLLGLGADVLHVDIAVGVAAGHDHLHAAHLRAGRVGPMRRFRDQADVAVALATRLVVGTNRQQAGVFALRAGVGLEADRVVAGDVGQHGFERVDQLLVAAGLRSRRQRMDVGELRPGDRDHLGGGVELHGARAQRDHRAVHRQVLVGQRTHVAQQFVLAVVGVEHRVLQERRVAQLGRGQGVGGGGVERVDRVVAQLGAEDLGQRGQVGAGGGLVQADADAGGVDLAQVDALVAGVQVHLFGVHAGDQQGVKEAIRHLYAGLAQRGGQDRRHPVHAARDPGQAFWPVVDRVHGRHHRQQHLRGADVGGGLLAADVLLAGLQGQAVGGIAVGVDRNPDQAAGHGALVGVAAGHERRVRAAEAERHAEALAVADHDVRAPFARRLDQGQREQVGGHGDDALARMHRIGQGGMVGDGAEGVGVLQQHAEAVHTRRLGGRADLQVDAQAVGTRAHHLQGLRVHVVGDVEQVGLRLGRALGQGHGLGRGAGLVQQRGVGDVHAGQVGAHLLEVDQRLHAALGDLGLVGRVGGVPGRVLQDVAQDDVGRVGAVVALADEAAEDVVPVGDGADPGQRLDFGQAAGQGQSAGALDAGRDDGRGQRVERVVADHAQHGGDLGVVGADVAADEGIVVLEFAQAGLALGGGVLGHGGGPDRGRRAPRDRAAECPSVLLPESLEAARTRSRLRAPSAPALPAGAAGLSRVLFTGSGMGA